MNILSLIYSIPLPVPSQQTATYASSSFSHSTASTQPSSPASTSPTSDHSEPLPPRSASSLSARYTDSRSSSETTRVDVTDMPDGAVTIGTAMAPLDALSSPGASPRTPVAPAIHPYAMPAVTTPKSRLSVSTPPPRAGRQRAASALPPPAPPPTTSPPPAPTPPETTADLTITQALRPPDIVGRPRGPSVSHRRTGSSSKLGALREEIDRREGEVVEPDYVVWAFLKYRALGALRSEVRDLGCARVSD